jgi:four helix bundle protein
LVEAYQVALDFFDLAEVVIEQLRQRGARANLANQLSRAALSIVNNLAEGAGRFSKPDKIRFYTTAIGSATESAATDQIASDSVPVPLPAPDSRHRLPGTGTGTG